MIGQQQQRVQRVEPVSGLRGQRQELLQLGPVAQAARDFVRPEGGVVAQQYDRALLLRVAS